MKMGDLVWKRLDGTCVLKDLVTLTAELGCEEAPCWALNAFATAPMDSQQRTIINTTYVNEDKHARLGRPSAPLPCPSLPCPSLPCLSLLCSSLPCPSLPCPSLLCSSLPCPSPLPFSPLLLSPLPLSLLSLSPLLLSHLLLSLAHLHSPSPLPPSPAPLPCPSPYSSLLALSSIPRSPAPLSSALISPAHLSFASFSSDPLSSAPLSFAPLSSSPLSPAPLSPTPLSSASFSSKSADFQRSTVDRVPARQGQPCSSSAMSRSANAAGRRRANAAAWRLHCVAPAGQQRTHFAVPPVQVDQPCRPARPLLQVCCTSRTHAHEVGSAQTRTVPTTLGPPAHTAAPLEE
ncbi:unnamed protein product [Closterium sp. NIES-53]